MKRLLVAAVLLAPVLPATAQTAPAPAPSADRDPQCFVLTAVGAQQLMSARNQTPLQRQAEERLRATATFYAGRLSTRLSGEALRRALAEATTVVQSGNRGPLVESCMSEFQAFMRSVATSAPGGPQR